MQQGPALQFVRDVDDKHDASHERLRDDHRGLENRVIVLEASHAEMVQQFSQVERRTGDVSQLKLSPAMVATIVAASISIAGGVWATNYSLRSDVRDILTRMEAQADSAKADTKLQDERAANITRAISELKATATMQDLKISNLRELVLSNQRKP